MIKVIASDMDGTLLGDDHKIAPETQVAIKRACDAGIRFMVATGRNFRGAMDALKDTDIICDYILSSGAEVRNPQREVVKRTPIPIDLCEEVYEELKEYPVSVIFFTDRYDYRLGTKKEIEEGIIRQIRLFHMDKNDSDEKIRNSAQFLQIAGNTRGISDIRSLEECETPVYKIFIFAGDVDMLQEIGEKLGQNPELAVASSFILNQEVTEVRAQKGPVLKEYIESLGYTMDEVMVLGDSFNDYSMLSMDFGATVAMGNSVPGIKEVAKYITKTNQEFGVAWAIDQAIAAGDGELKLQK